MPHGQPDVAHPIVAAALAEHGTTPAEVAAGVGWAEGRRTILHDDRAGAVRVECRRQLMVVERRVGAVEAIFRHYVAIGGVHHARVVAEMELRGWWPPATLEAALAGRPLGEVAAIPGGEHVVIESAERTPKGMVLILQDRTEEEERGAAMA